MKFFKVLSLHINPLRFSDPIHGPECSLSCMQLNLIHLCTELSISGISLLVAIVMTYVSAWCQETFLYNNWEELWKEKMENWKVSLGSCRSWHPQQLNKAHERTRDSHFTQSCAAFKTADSFTIYYVNGWEKSAWANQSAAVWVCRVSDLSNFWVFNSWWNNKNHKFILQAKENWAWWKTANSFPTTITIKCFISLRKVRANPCLSRLGLNRVHTNSFFSACQQIKDK